MSVEKWTEINQGGSNCPLLIKECHHWSRWLVCVANGNSNSMICIEDVSFSNTPKILILVPDFEYITLKKIFLRICSIFAFCNECNMQIKECYRKMFGYYNASDSKQRWQLRVIIHDNIIRLVCFKRNLTSFWLAYKTALWYLKNIHSHFYI